MPLQKLFGLSAAIPILAAIVLALLETYEAPDVGSELACKCILNCGLKSNVRLAEDPARLNETPAIDREYMAPREEFARVRRTSEALHRHGHTVGLVFLMNTILATSHTGGNTNARSSKGRVIGPSGFHIAAGSKAAMSPSARRSRRCDCAQSRTFTVGGRKISHSRRAA
jgi:hypothetical protein